MDILNKNIQFVKGIGPKKALKLNKLNIFTIKDLLYYFPRAYEDRSKVKKIWQLEHDEKACTKGVITSVKSHVAKNNIKISKFIIKDETALLTLVFFNQDYLTKVFKQGDSVIVYGKVKREGSILEMNSPEIEFFTNSPTSTCKMIPIYPLTYGVTNKDIVNTVKNVYNNEGVSIKEYLPQYIIDKYKLCSIDFAVKNLHMPSDKQSLKIALYRMIFEEFLILQIGLFYLKNGIDDEKGIKFEKKEKLNDIIKSLPFKLTNAQSRAFDEVIEDMQSENVMNRLIQGDVGSGKTIVATLVLALAVLNGYQGALMAPTEILARQHYISLNDTLSPFDINVGLLVGSLTKKQKEKVLDKVKNGEIDILIGTHALIEDNVEFDNLGIVVTDEQHRFGVRQRAKLSTKGNNPDILVMTATPIPRTLALILYGDLDISIIDELPPGRQPIDTKAFEAKQRDFIYTNFIRDEIDKGRQVYVVCPLVEESEAIEAKAAEDLKEELKEKYFSDLNVEVLHGKMKPSLKDQIMNDFKKNKIQILVSTTVIEVGVNVPNATLMIIENAERFGLAQLHQLRGRVGRGSHKSHCILIYSSKSNICKQRMEIMEETNDGFKISEKDLEIRGPGEFFGTRQHGLPELKVANIFKHIKILKLAQEEAKNILKNDKNLSKNENILLKKEIIEKFSDIDKEISLN
ncbi:MAG: ATP-dependent DNA helicase RecG [Intestinibacter sp.]|uniref:ATP-dependent DNA helicase RecG n=1 Tax=Intestinibacter sp. TaxID=1965304 RepID=UPI0025B9190C|nr:ATP-dependent DNA helicase RecG [Intestinibacter sp.]MCI6737248.1 ATP-dependent DNA helicase RecG [Intestinibacter sp.]